MRASIADAAAATGCAKGTQARASAAHGYAARQCRDGQWRTATPQRPMPHGNAATAGAAVWFTLGVIG
jgi:hypothetical protein